MLGILRLIDYNSKIHLAVPGRKCKVCICCSVCILDAYGRIVRVFITAGTTADCTLGLQLIEGIEVLALLADKGYDVNTIIEYARKMGIEVCIPPKSNRIEQREYDEELYKYRYIVEKAFLMLKGWRGIATRYAKKTSSFLAAVRMRCLLDYLKWSR